MYVLLQKQRRIVNAGGLDVFMGRMIFFFWGGGEMNLFSPTNHA